MNEDTSIEPQTTTEQGEDIEPEVYIDDDANDLVEGEDLVVTDEEDDEKEGPAHERRDSDDQGGDD